MAFPFWLAFVFFLALPVSLGEGAPVDPSQADPPEKQEQRNTPWLELHGDYRYLYGKGRFAARTPANLKKSRWPRTDQDVFLLQRRLRLFPVVHTSQDTQLKFMIEDKRNDKDHTQDHHPTLSRAYLQHENSHTKWELGRFNLYLMDGNVIDKRVDGIRTSFGKNTDPGGRLTLFAGQTTGNDNLHRKTGWFALEEKQLGKLNLRSAFLDFRTRQSLPASLPALQQPGLEPGASGTGFDRQQIWTTRLEYQPRDRWLFDLELLGSKGSQGRDGYRERKTGFVAAVTYGELDERKGGTWETWLRYYDQPQSSILYHTMDGDTGFFQRQRFRGWGARLDYVVFPGLVWAIEGFRLQNRKTGPFTRDFREWVLGTSVTAYF